MTGYGKASAEISGTTYHVELHSLNSKRLDLRVDLPSRLREKEMEIRSWAAECVPRGKLNLNLFLEREDREQKQVIDQDQVRSYYEQLQRAAQKLKDEKDRDYFDMALRMPEVIKWETTDLKAEEWKGIRSLLEEAWKEFRRFTEKEGAEMEKDLRERLQLIREALEQVEKQDKDREDTIRNRIRQKLEASLSPDQVDENRFEQELVYYLEKLDITEEKVRLKAHCDHFEELVASGEPQVGKKLGFIAQEIGREINTIGSKANDAAIQKLVVRMKDELEKIKEQGMNVL